MPDYSATECPASVHWEGSMFNLRTTRNCYTKPGVSSDVVSDTGRDHTVMGYHVKIS